MRELAGQRVIRQTKRHRLNRGGDRHANSALWTIVLTRMSNHPPTRAYVERRTAEGLSKREIIRCLKRYVAREVFPLVRNIVNEHDTATRCLTSRGALTYERVVVPRLGHVRDQRVATAPSAIDTRSGREECRVRWVLAFHGQGPGSLHEAPRSALPDQGDNIKKAIVGSIVTIVAVCSVAIPAFGSLNPNPNPGYLHSCVGGTTSYTAQGNDISPFVSSNGIGNVAKANDVSTKDAVNYIKFTVCG